MRKLLRSSLVALLSLATASVAKVSAQIFEWTNYTGAGTLWSTPANWTPLGPPTASPTTQLIFGFSPPNAPPTFPFAPVGNYTSTNDGATPFVLNSILLNGFGANDVSANGIVLTTNNAAGGFNFQGSNPTIT